MRLLLTIAAITTALLASPTYAADYDINYAESTVKFSGTHAGNAFEGAFEKWNAEIHLDPENLETSGIEATFDTSSAKTGNKMYDGTLPQDDWFDVKNHPEATFSSDTITANDDGTYTANGHLTIREIKHPISFSFTLTEEAETTHAKSSFSFDRLLYNIGKKSDASAEWVGKDITIDLSITAKKL